MTQHTVNYAYLHGSGGEIQRSEVSLAGFLLEIPNLFCFGYMPPLPVINSFLATGIADAGMSGGCRWTPFELSVPEYNEILADLKTTNRSGRRPTNFIDAPAYVRSKNEWTSWVYQQEFGANYEEVLALKERESDLNERKRIAAENGEAELAEVLHLEWYKAANELWAVLEPLITRQRNE
jgi:hypothetical protein